MRDAEYANAVARIRMNENRLLSAEDTERLITAPTPADAVGIVTERGLCRRDGDTADFSGSLDEMRQLIVSVVPDEKEFLFLLIDNDFHNLKTVIKAAVADKPTDGLLLPEISCSVDDMKKAIGEKKFDLLPEYMSSAARRAYSLITETGDGQLCDAVLDRAYCGAVISLTEKSGDFIRNLGELIAADCCMRTAARCAFMKKDKDFIELSVGECRSLQRKRLIDAAAKSVGSVSQYLSHTAYETQAQALSESIRDFEKQCEDMLLRYCDSAKYTALGPAPIAAYIIRKKAQIKTARIVIGCKTAGLSEQMIRQRVRKTV